MTEEDFPSLPSPPRPRRSAPVPEPPARPRPQPAQRPSSQTRQPTPPATLSSPPGYLLVSRQDMERTLTGFGIALANILGSEVEHHRLAAAAKDTGGEDLLRGTTVFGRFNYSGSRSFLRLSSPRGSIPACSSSSLRNTYSFPSHTAAPALPKLPPSVPISPAPVAAVRRRADPLKDLPQRPLPQWQRKTSV